MITGIAIAIATGVTLPGPGAGFRRSAACGGARNSATLSAKPGSGVAARAALRTEAPRARGPVPFRRRGAIDVLFELADPPPELAAEIAKLARTEGDERNDRIPSLRPMDRARAEPTTAERTQMHCADLVRFSARLSSLIESWENDDDV